MSWLILALPVVVISVLITISARKNWKGREIKEQENGKETD